MTKTKEPIRRRQSRPFRAPKGTLTVDDAAERIGKTAHWVREKIREGKLRVVGGLLPGNRLPFRTLIPEASVEALLEGE